MYTHIDTGGAQVHGKLFKQLGVYHKNIATAQDHEGWFHIDSRGHPLYSQRYASLEVFYNDAAYAITTTGDTVLISPPGAVELTIRPASLGDIISSLSGKMVGFWQTAIIRLAVRLGIPDILPATIETMRQQTQLPINSLQRVIRALWENRLIEPIDGNLWDVTPQGAYLRRKHPYSMAHAAEMWMAADIQSDWYHLEERLLTPPRQHNAAFKETETDPNKRLAYEQAVLNYARIDFAAIATSIDWAQHQHIVALGSSGKVILPLIHQSFPELTTTWAADHNAVPNNAEAIIMGRYLHYLPHNEAVSILTQLRESTSRPLYLYIVEMILQEDSPFGGTLDLHMLAETGGEERTQQAWHRVIKQAGFSLQEFIPLSPLLSILVVK